MRPVKGMRSMQLRAAVAEAIERRILLSGAPGTLDTSFAGTGYFIDSPGSQANAPQFTAAEQVAVTATVLTLVAGQATVGTEEGIYLRRYLSNGTVDNTFGIGQGYNGQSGYMFIPTGPAGSPQPTATGLVIDPSGRMILGISSLGLLRFLPNGSPDTSFGSGGTFGFSKLDNFIMEGDGQFIATSGTNTLTKIGVNGLELFQTTVPVTFGPEGGDWVGTVYAPIAVQSDGSILVGGTALEPFLDQDGVYHTNDDLAVARVSSTGVIDTTLGSEGVAWADFSHFDQGSIGIALPSAATQLAVLPNGTIVAAGYSDFDSDFNGNNHVVVAEFTSTGQPVTNFGTDGQYAFGEVDGYETAETEASLIALPTGNLVFGFTGEVGDSYDAVALVELPANGQSSSSSDFYVVTQFPAQASTVDGIFDVVLSAVSSENGTLTMVGTSSNSNYGPFSSVVARFNLQSTGTVSGTVYDDDTYGNGTNLTTDPGEAGQTVYADLSNNGTYEAADPNAVTDANGNYTLTGVPQGAVIIRQELQTGERQSYPAAGAGQHVTVSGTPATGVNFGETTDVYVSGTVTVNGHPFAGATVYDYYTNNALYNVSAVTAADGSFSFSSLPGSNYIFGVNPPPGYVQSVPADDAPITLNLGSGAIAQNLNFAFVQQTPTILTGTIIGTSGSYKNSENTASNAFDGNLSTFFDAPSASGNWTGLDLGSLEVINQISFAPRSGWASRMVGGVFQGSNSATFSSGVSTLYTVTTIPATGVYSTVPVEAGLAFRYVRYLGPANSYCDVADIKLYGPSSFAALQSNGTLLISGTSGADDIIVQTDTSEENFVAASVDGVSQIFGEAFIDAIDVSTFGGNDSVTVGTFSYYEQFPVPPITVTARNGNDDFNMDIAAEGDFVQNSLVSIAAGDGGDSFQLAGGAVDYTVTAGNGNDDFQTNVEGNGDVDASITAGNGNDDFGAGTAVNAYQYIYIDAGTGYDYIANTDPDDSVGGTVGGQSFNLAWSNFTISDYQLGNVYADINGDGKYEAGEPLVGGAPVTVASEGTTLSTTTNNSGYYSLVTGTSYPSQGGDLISGVNFALPQPLGGNNIGTTGSYQNDGDTITKAFDGNLSTFFDGPTANGDWAGRDLGSAHVITAIAYAPRSGWASRMVGGVFQGSNSASFASATNLYTVTTAPTTGVLTYVPISNTSAFRYVRYLSPNGSYGDVAEVQFFGSASTGPSQLTGTAIGTLGSYRNQGNTIANVFDGNLSTFFDGPDTSGDWVGLDLGSAKVVTAAEYAPRAGWANRMVGGEIQASNSANFSSGVVTLYKITSAPTAGVLTTASFTNTTAYRYYRYLGPTDGYCDIAELVFEG